MRVDGTMHIWDSGIENIYIRNRIEFLTNKRYEKMENIKDIIHSNALRSYGSQHFIMPQQLAGSVTRRRNRCWNRNQEQRWFPANVRTDFMLPLKVTVAWLIIMDASYPYTVTWEGKISNMNITGGSGRANFYYYMEYTTADNFTTSTAVWQMPYVVSSTRQPSDSGSRKRATWPTRQRQKPLLTNMMQKQKFCAPWHCLTHVSTVNLIRQIKAAHRCAIATSHWNRQKAKPQHGSPMLWGYWKGFDRCNQLKCTAQNQWSGLCQPLGCKALQVRVYDKGEWSKLYPPEEDIISNSSYKL